MRNTLCFAGLLLLFALTGSAAAADLKSTLERKLSEVLQEPVTLGRYEVSLNPPRAVLQDLTVGERVPEAGGRPLAEIEKLTVDYIPSALLVGGPFFSSMRFEGTRFHVGADAQGRSNFQRFLQRMLDRKSDDLPGLGELDFAQVTFLFHAPKPIAAPEGTLTPEPVLVTLETLKLRSLSAPQTKDQAGPPPSPWTEIAFEKLNIEAPARGNEAPATLLPNGAILDEGVSAAGGMLELKIHPDRPKLLLVRHAKLDGLRARSFLPAPGETETFLRIRNTLRAGLLGDAGYVEKGKELSVYVYDAAAEHAIVDFAGPDPTGRTAYWRLSDLKFQAQQLGFGTLGRSPADRPGFLTLVSPTQSSEGDGFFDLRWNRLADAHPDWSFECDLDVTRLALPALSTRMGNRGDAGFVRGHLGLRFRGPVRAGRMDLSGSLTVSSDTRLAASSDAERRSRSLTRVANGQPIEPIRITGRLSDPKVELPDYAKHAFAEVMDGIFNNKVTRFLGNTVEGVGKAAGDVIKRVPILGPLFGGDED